MKFIELIKSDYLFLSEEEKRNLILLYKHSSKEKRQEIERILEKAIDANKKDFLNEIRSLATDNEITLGDLYYLNKDLLISSIENIKKIQKEKEEKIGKIKQKFEEYKLNFSKLLLEKTKQCLSKISEEEDKNRKKEIEEAENLLNSI